MNPHTSQHISDLFIEKLSKKSAIILGFDPIMEKIPNFILNKPNNKTAYHNLCAFFDFMLESLQNKLAAIKLQSADFECYGIDGMRALSYCLKKTKANNILSILDVKRGDIGRSSEAYAEAYLAPYKIYNNQTHPNDFEADAITISPFLGDDALLPFIQKANQYNKLLFILLNTSNPGAQLIQDLKADNKTISEHLCDWIGKQSQDPKQLGENQFSRIGVVIGATKTTGPQFRKALPHSLFLMPGLGAQGGSTKTIKNCMNTKKQGVIAPVSRALLYPNIKTESAASYKATIQEIFDTLKAETENTRE